MSLHIPHPEALVEGWDTEHESSAPQYANPCIDAETGPEASLGIWHVVLRLLLGQHYPHDGSSCIVLT